jgi:hypothetical protein
MLGRAEIDVDMQQLLLEGRVSTKTYELWLVVNTPRSKCYSKMERIHTYLLKRLAALHAVAPDIYSWSNGGSIRA